jgi:hypothetical protein
MTDFTSKEVDDILNSDEEELVMEGDYDAQLESILEDGGDDLPHNDPLQGLPASSQPAHNTLFTADSDIPLRDNSQLEALMKDKKPRREAKAETVDPLDLLDRQERENLKKTDKPIIQQLNIKRNESRKLPIINLDDIKPISLKVTSNLYGMPTSLAVSTSFILIGTTQGILTQYEMDGIEIRCMKRGSEFGAVTALDISQDELLAIAGYHNGQVGLWDLKSGSSLRASNAIHSTAVLAVRFWRAPNNRICVVTSDARGMISLVEYSKSLFSVNIQHRVLISGELRICPAIEPLFASNSPHPTDRYSIFALGSTRKMALYTLYPSENLIYILEKPEGVREDAPVYLSWQRGMAPGDSNSTDPILAVGWERRLYLYRVSDGTQQGISMVATYDLESELKGMLWLGVDKILVMDSTQEILVYITTLLQKNPLEPKNPKAKVEQEALYIVQMVSQYYLLNAMNKPIMTFHNSLKSNGREVYFLGTKGFHRARLLNWKEAIVKLIKDGCWLEVLSLGLDLYDRKELYVYDKPRTSAELLTLLKDVAQEYVRFGVQNEHKIPNTIEFCISIGATDLLFGEFYEYILMKSVDKKAINLFMDSLEPYIIADRVQTIPELMLGKMINHYLQIHKPEIIEKLIMHLDPVLINPDFILPHCKEYRLTTASIFINTQSIKKSHINALKLLREVMRQHQTEDQRRYCVHKILWFLRMTIKGETFPSGRIEEDLWPSVVVKLTEWLTKKTHLYELLEVDGVTPFQVIWLLYESGRPAEVLRTLGSTLHTDLLHVLEMACERLAGIYSQYTLFVAKVVSEKAAIIPKKECIKVANFLMAPPRQSLSYSEVYSRATAMSSEYAELQYNIEKKGTLILSMLRETEGFTDEEIENLLKVTLNTPQ